VASGGDEEDDLPFSVDEEEEIPTKNQPKEKRSKVDQFDKLF
jgi:hypothetical protein